MSCKLQSSSSNDEKSKKQKSSIKNFARKLKLIKYSSRCDANKKERTKNALEDYIREQNWHLALKELNEEQQFRQDFLFEAMFLQRCNSDETQNSDGDEDNIGKGESRNLNILLMACKNGAPESVVIAIMALYPKMIMSVSGESRKTPLHLACESGSSLGAIESLCDEMLEVSPSTINKLDSEGMTALCYALKNKAPLEVVSYLSDMSIVVEQAARLNRKLAKQSNSGTQFLDLDNRRISKAFGVPASNSAKKA